LAHGAGPDRHIRGLCECGASGAIDPSAWIKDGVGGQPPCDFRTKVRCSLCGAETVEHQAAAPEGAMMVT